MNSIKKQKILQESFRSISQNELTQHQQQMIVKENSRAIHQSKIFRQVKIANMDINLAIVQGDITQEESDAIVCPANNFLQFNGGVAEQILKIGGKCILEEVEDIIQEKIMVPTGTVEVTLAGRMQAKYIIHAVGPNLNDPSQLGLDRSLLLKFAINNALQMAEDLECHSISIPAIATGSFGFPKKKCAQIMFDCLLNYGNEKGDSAKLKYVRFINNDLKTTEVFVNEFDQRLLENAHYS